MRRAALFQRRPVPPRLRPAGIGTLAGMALLAMLVAACGPAPGGRAPTGAATSPAIGREEEAMILTVVFDNYPPARPGAGADAGRLQTGWGFSAWLEHGGHRVLFDTGASGAVLLDNMAALGLDPAAVEIVVLSHNHGDHTGGLASLLAVNPQVTVYLPQAFPPRLKRQVRTAGATVVEVTGPQEILPGLWSTGQMGSRIVEQALVARTEKGLLVVTGCAHPGVDEMATRAGEIAGGEITLVVGGFHLGGASRQRVEEIITTFRRLGVEQVAPCHCTGDEAREIFCQAYGEDYFPCSVGWQW